MHTVAVLIPHNFVPSDLAIPCDVFSRARTEDAAPLYRVRVCGEVRKVRCGLFEITADFGLEGLLDADTIIIVGIDDPDKISMRVIEALRAAAMRGCRLASICSGAFILAATGLLDGLRATTHWRGASELARRHPAVTVDANVLFVDNGKLLSSAGASAGLDLCLHLIRIDYGAAAAAAAAKLAVAPLAREGGQAQYIDSEMLETAGALVPLMDWVRHNLREPINLAQMAARASMSPRTLTRRFIEQTGAPPLQWLGVARVRRAQQILETTSLSVEAVATEVGFKTAAAFRERFRRVVGVSPRHYKVSFGKT